MREIEIKVRIAGVQAVVDKIIARGGAVAEPVTQHDRVYGMPGVKGGEQQSSPWLRIRTETRGVATRHLFTLKRSVTSQLDSIEHETEVLDAAELESIIRELSFVPYSDLTKTRIVSHLGEIEICIDHIAELGDFMEAEKLTTDDADITEIREELWNVLQDLGASNDDEVTDGYDVLMNKKLGRE